MGIIELVKFVLLSMLLYRFQIYLWPASLIKYLDTCIRNFVWSGDPNVKKICTVALHKMSRPYVEGG